jgi:hypothetical protein
MSMKFSFSTDESRESVERNAPEGTTCVRCLDDWHDTEQAEYVCVYCGKALCKSHTAIYCGMSFCTGGIENPCICGREMATATGFVNSPKIGICYYVDRSNPVCTPVTKPIFEHDCQSCVYLATVTYEEVTYTDYGSFHKQAPADLYYCPQGGIPVSTLIARFSDDGPDYTSGLSAGRDSWLVRQGQHYQSDYLYPTGQRLVDHLMRSSLGPAYELAYRWGLV